MPGTQSKRIRAFVTGRVQGVWFRKSTRDEATRLGLSGWVRNRSDGRVELVAEGVPDAVDRLIRWAHDGPRDARVDDVACEEEPVSGAEPPFEVRY